MKFSLLPLLFGFVFQACAATPETTPFLQSNNYKEKQYPVWNLLPELYRQGHLTPPQAFLCAPAMPPEELYDLRTDPHAINNLANSPAHQKILKKLRSVLEEWIQNTGDLGRTLESEALVEKAGLTKPGNPNAGYALLEN